MENSSSRWPGANSLLAGTGTSIEASWSHSVAAATSGFTGFLGETGVGLAASLGRLDGDAFDFTAFGLVGLVAMSNPLIFINFATSLIREGAKIVIACCVANA